MKGAWGRMGALSKERIRMTLFSFFESYTGGPNRTDSTAPGRTLLAQHSARPLIGGRAISMYHGGRA